MFDRETFEAELQQGNKFLQTIKYWESFPLEDYSILPKINMKLGDLNNLADAASSESVSWFMNGKYFNKWQKEMLNNSSSVKERIELYS